MAYEVNWLLQDRIIYVLNTGIGTADDVINANREVIAMLEQSQPVVHLVIEGKTEKNDIGLGELLTIIRSSPASPNLGWVVYISENKMNRFFGSMASQIAKADSKSFTTLPQAIEFLQHTDLTLPENIPLP